MEKDCSSQHIHAILDRSGSMHGKIQDVIGGLKSNIEELKRNKKENERISISIKLFDDYQDIILPSKNIEELDNATIDTILEGYKARGQTALRDALGDSVNYFMNHCEMNVQQNLKTMIYVMTDGLENASKHYTSERLQEMIQNAKTKDITVYYIGSNQDSIFQAKQIGIGQGHAMNFHENNESNQSLFRSLAAVAQRSRTGNDDNFTMIERISSVQ